MGHEADAESPGGKRIVSLGGEPRGGQRQHVRQRDVTAIMRANEVTVDELKFDI